MCSYVNPSTLSAIPARLVKVDHQVPISFIGRLLVRVSERFFERTQVELVGPRRAVLPVQLPIRFGDGGGVEQAVLALVSEHLRKARPNTIAIDSAVNH